MSVPSRAMDVPNRCAMSKRYGVADVMGFSYQRIGISGSQPRGLHVHPVEVALAAEAHPALLLPYLPPTVVFGAGKAGLVAAPVQLVVLRVIVEGHAPAMGAPTVATAHPANVEASAPDVEAQALQLRHAVGVLHLGEDAQKAVMHLGVALEGADGLVHVPRDAVGVWQLDALLVGSCLPVECDKLGIGAL
jgi:hypothetical protein